MRAASLSGITTTFRAASPAFGRGRPRSESCAGLFPADGQAAVLAVTGPLRWLTEWQTALARLMYANQSTLAIIGISALALIPVLVVAAGSWCTMLALYPIP